MLSLHDSGFSGLFKRCMLKQAVASADRLSVPDFRRFVRLVLRRLCAPFYRVVGVPVTADLPEGAELHPAVTFLFPV